MLLFADDSVVDAVEAPVAAESVVAGLASLAASELDFDPSLFEVPADGLPA